MAACGSLHHIFENPLPENPSLIESLSSWKNIKPIDQSSFTDIFGELHFKENNSSSSPSSYNFSSMNSESLQLCTEGLGFESSDDVEELKSEIIIDWRNEEKNVSSMKNSPSDSLSGEFRRSRTNGGGFPPPISSIGKSGTPWVWFKSYREDGRFVLKEIRMPAQEILHASREDGRLKLQFVQPNDEILEEDDEGEDEVEQEQEQEADDEQEENRRLDDLTYKEKEDNSEVGIPFQVPFEFP